MSHTTTDIPALIRAHGYRLTPQRQIILDTLCAMGGHVTVAELFERVHAHHPAIDRSTVYRGLDFFRELGLVSAAEIGGAAIYEISADAHPAHNHLVCRGCGDIDHLPADLFDDFAARLRDQFGFRADMDSLTISGFCRECEPVDGA